MARPLEVTFRHEVFGPSDFAEAAADLIIRSLPGSGSVVLTGGSTVGPVYERLRSADWSGIDVYFSDERCVPPDDDASNHRLARTTLLDHVTTRSVHRIRGEEVPGLAADFYEAEVRDVAPAGFDLVLLGMGDDCHICALFPGSPKLVHETRLVAAVERPDGLEGVTLTGPALTPAKKILVVVAGSSKAAAVARALGSTETPETCPVRLLADHPDTTFVLDEAAATGL